MGELNIKSQEATVSRDFILASIKLKKNRCRFIHLHSLMNDDFQTLIINMPFLQFIVNFIHTRIIDANTICANK